MAWTYADTANGYRNMWNEATILPAAQDDLLRIAKRIIANEDKYKEVEAATKVPWFWIAAIHDREASGDFEGVLHNGEKIIGKNQKTTLVPAGRGPFKTWQEAAIDALQYEDLDDVDKWDLPQMLLQAELYNGKGYIGKGVNSPYVWAGTSKQQAGKYVADRKWDPTAWDTQMGVAGVLKKLAELRPDIAARLATGAGTAAPAPVPVPTLPGVPSLPVQGVDLGPLLTRFAPVLIQVITFVIMSESMTAEQRAQAKQKLILDLITGLFAPGTAIAVPAAPVQAPAPTPQMGDLFGGLIGPLLGGALTGGAGPAASIGTQLIGGLLQTFINGMANQRR